MVLAVKKCEIFERKDGNFISCMEVGYSLPRASSLLLVNFLEWSAGLDSDDNGVTLGVEVLQMGSGRQP